MSSKEERERDFLYIYISPPPPLKTKTKNKLTMSVMQSRPSMVTLTSRGKSSQFTFLERSMMAVLSRGKHVLVRFTRVTNTLRSTSISTACCTLVVPMYFCIKCCFLKWHRFNRSCPVIHAHKRSSIHRISIFGVKLFWREIFF